MQRPDLAADPLYGGAAGRRDHQDHLDAAITEWTMQHEDHVAMQLLQQAGVPSGPSQDILRVFNEPQLREAGYFTELHTNGGGLRDLPGLPWRLDGGPEPYLTEAPVLGQHNAYVYQEMLGLPALEVDRMIEDQIIY